VVTSGVTADAFGAAARRRKAAAPATAAAPRQIKFTVLLDAGEAAVHDGTLLRLRGPVGRKVARSEVVRELLGLLDEDPALAEQVAERLRRRGDA
jgi:hypothetical protein